MKKKILEAISLVVLMGLPLMAASNSHAGGDSAINSSTGSSSSNTASVSYSNISNILIENVANVSNAVLTTAITGENSANANSGSGSVSTGDIQGNVSITDKLNISDIKLAESLPEERNFFEVRNNSTGAGSSNSASYASTTTQNLVALNTLDVVNSAVADLSTGGNEASGNSGNGSVSTGDINFSVNFETIGNLIKIAIGGKGGGVFVPVDPPIYGGKGGGGPVLAEAVEIMQPLTLPAAGADNLMLIILFSAIGTVFIVEVTNRKQLVTG